MRFDRLRALLGIGVATAALAAPFAAAQNGPRPFVATYTVQWKGFNAGTTTLDLKPQNGTRYVYRSRMMARGLFRLAFPDEITQTSIFSIANGMPRPLSYRADDGSSRTERDVALDFDWQGNRVTGTAERQPVDLALQPGVQDAMSVQIAMMLALATQAAPTTFLMIDKNEVKDYVYAPEGTAKLQTALGELDTVIWSSRRPDSDRVTRMWYAPSLGFIPVRAERTRGSRIEWGMAIRALQRP
ncbi:MAG: DUF3108 domain-containing protein [Steroidobacteraceae bacterium]